MKAADYANKLVEEQRGATRQEKIRATTTVLNTVIYDKLKAVNLHSTARQADPVIAGKFRESLSMWKAIVTKVKASDPEYPIEVNYFGLFILTHDEALFDRLMRLRVFLGYEFSAREQSILDSIRQAQVNAACAALLRRRLDVLLTSFYEGDATESTKAFHEINTMIAAARSNNEVHRS